MTTKDVSVTPGAGPADLLAPSPKPTKTTKPETPFSAMMDRAETRKSDHPRTTRTSVRDRGDEDAATPSRSRTGRGGKVDGHFKAASRPTKRVGNAMGTKPDGLEQQDPAESPTAQDTAADSSEFEPGLDGSDEESAPAKLEAKMPRDDSPDNIVPFPGVAAPSAVIIPFPLTEAQAAAPEAAEGTSSAGAGEIDAIGLSKGDTPRSPRNVVMLPQSAPSAQSALRDSVGATVNGAENSEKSEGIDVKKLGLDPLDSLDSPPLSEPSETGGVLQNGAAADNREPPSHLESKIIEIAFDTERVREPREASTRPTTPAKSQLPGDPAEVVESAASLPPHETSAKIVLLRTDAASSASGALQSGSLRAQQQDRKPAGTTVAKQDVYMESMTTTSERDTVAEPGEAIRERSSGPAALANDAPLKTLVTAEWQSGRAISEIDRSAPGGESSGSIAAAGAVERISSLVMRESALVRKHGSDSMAVVLRPDAETELFVHLSQRDGQMEATVRCERGDVHQLGALWTQLQESLALQKIRLSPLQDSSGGNSNFNQSAGPGMGDGRNGAREEARPEKQSMDDWPAPAAPESPAPHVRGTGSSRRRRTTTSRPGWETWA